MRENRAENTYTLFFYYDARFVGNIQSLLVVLDIFMNRTYLHLVQNDVFRIDQVKLVAEEEGLGNGKGSVIFCCAVDSGDRLEFVRVSFIPVDNLGKKCLHEIVILVVDEAHDLRVIQQQLRPV